MSSAVKSPPGPLLPLREDARFQPLRAQAEAHWRKYLPKYVSLLEKESRLDASLDSAAERAVLVLQQCEQKGLAPSQARELANQEILLPAE